MLPLELNKLLIIVVVLSMALTPLLNEVGRRAAVFIDEKIDAGDVCSYTCEVSLKLLTLNEKHRETSEGLKMRSCYVRWLI